MFNNLNLSSRIALLGGISPRAAAVGAVSTPWLDMQMLSIVMAPVSIGAFGAEPTVEVPSKRANDAKGNIYVGDRGNQRIQVFDPELNPLRIISNVRAPWAMCITPPNAQGQQFLYSADAGGKIYKEDLEGHLLGWFGTIGKKVGSSTGCTRCTASASTSSTRAKRRTGGFSA